MSDEPGVDHHPRDARLLGLEPRGEGRWAFTLTEPLARLDGKLYGGTALAISLATAEAVTGRRALWSTTQFVSSIAVGEGLDVHTEALAHGGRASQVRVTATGADGEVVFTALGATARLRPQGLAGAFEVMPEVTAPEDSEPFRLPFAEQLGERRTGFERHLELRVARHTGATAGSGRTTLWARVRGCTATPAVLGYLADFVPLGVARAAGRAGGGISLDNTLRVGPPTEVDWVLLDVDPQLAVGGYAHGTVHLWSPDGVLLGTGSQTASMLLFD
jgi:acyl-CoA thioesterase II